MADDTHTPPDDLISKHKQERKDLQARIQALKKTVTKGDKKKKKEVQEEITQLETDLAKKHGEETAALSQTTPEAGQHDNEPTQPEHEENSPTGTDNSAQRVSKAQRRRDKKAAADKEREEKIKDQDKLNLQGPRHTESAAIVELLKQRGLMLYNIPADGNCLYKAIEHQLEQSEDETEHLKLTKLRKLTADHLRHHADDFLPFLTHRDTGEMMTPEQFEDYCRKVERTTAWGGQIELQALSSILKRRIEVIQGSGPPIILGEEYSSEKGTLILTYHRHMYRLGEHYNSVQPISKQDLENEFEPVPEQ